MKTLGSLSNDILNQNEYIQTIFPVALNKTFEKILLRLNPRSRSYGKVSQYQTELNTRVIDIQSQIVKKLTATIKNNNGFVVDTIEANYNVVLELIKDNFRSYQEIQDFKSKTKQSFTITNNELNKKLKLVLHKVRKIIDSYAPVERELVDFIKKLYVKPYVQEKVDDELNKFLYECNLLKNNVLYSLNDIIETVYRTITSKVDVTYEIINLRVLQNYY